MSNGMNENTHRTVKKLRKQTNKCCMKDVYKVDGI